MGYLRGTSKLVNGGWSNFRGTGRNSWRLSRKRFSKTDRKKWRYTRRMLNTLGRPYSFHRVCNLRDAAGTSVDGTYLTQLTQATGGMFKFTNGVATSQSYFGYMACAFELSDLPSYTQFTGLFQEYRILNVKVKLTPMGTEVNSESSTAGSDAMPLIVHSCIDYDNVLTPAGGSNDLTILSTMRQAATYKTQNMYQGGRSLVWNIAAPGVKVNAAATNAIQHSPWINIGSPSDIHYGLILVFESFARYASGSVYFKAEASYDLEFRGVI